MKNDDVEILERIPAYRGYGRIDQYRLRHRLHSGGMGNPIDREVYDRGQVSGVLPYDPDRDCVVMIEQFRVGAYLAGMRPWQTETVAGIIDEGESAEAVALREAKEEANLDVSDLIPICRYAVSPGALTETVALFAGRVDSRNAGGIHGLPEEGEDIKVTVVPVAELAGMIEDGRIGNSLTIIAVQWLLLYRDKLRASWKAAG